jgi:uncharacterized zinc-type alcohol dehydrogenase-like protein
MATVKNGSGVMALAAFDKNAELKKHELGRPKAGPNDVEIEVKFCGMCHSDLHATNGDWGMEAFPLAPGHEIAGVVKAVGSDVTNYKEGDLVGVGCFVDSCGECEQCGCGSQNYCKKVVQTYGTPYPEGKGHDDCVGEPTNGGYSTAITVKQDFVYAVPEGMELKYVGPLLCAGITMFNPLNKHVLKKGGNKSVGIVGFGGLGGMGAKLAKAMGCDVTFLSRSTSKKDEATKLGAGILAHSDEDALSAASGKFDVIIDTVSVQHEVQHMMSTLKTGGTYHLIGGVAQPFSVVPFNMILSNHHIEGSLVGGIPETQEMLEFCAKHNIVPEINVIHAKDANAQFKALADGSATTARAVIDMSTLSEL